MRYVLIGAVAARLQGFPRLTADADITPLKDPDNLERLAAALRELDARIYTETVPEGLPFDCSASMLERGDLWNLVTSAGRLDVAFTPSGTHGYHDLHRNAVRFEVYGTDPGRSSPANVLMAPGCGEPGRGQIADWRSSIGDSQPRVTMLREKRGRLSDQRIPDREARKTTEVPICRPQFLDAVMQTQGRDACVVYLRPGNATLAKQTAQRVPVPFGLRQQDQVWRLEPRRHLLDRESARRRGIVDARMGDDRKELVNTRPRHRPGRPRLGELLHTRVGRLVPPGVLAVRVDQQVGVYRDHVPRPS